MSFVNLKFYFLGNTKFKRTYVIMMEWLLDSFQYVHYSVCGGCGYNNINWCHPPTTCSDPALPYLVGGKQNEIETKLRYTKYMTYCMWLIEIQIVRQLAYVPS